MTVAISTWWIYIAAMFVLIATVIIQSFVIAKYTGLVQAILKAWRETVEQLLAATERSDPGEEWKKPPE